MRIRVPDDIVRKAEATASDIRVAIAIEFYAENRIDHADACRLSGLAPSALNRELLQRQISILQYPAPRRRRSAS